MFVTPMQSSATSHQPSAGMTSNPTLASGEVATGTLIDFDDQFSVSQSQQPPVFSSPTAISSQLAFMSKLFFISFVSLWFSYNFV